MPSLVEVSARVSAALRSGTPVVALESTIISHGLPRPGNLDAAREFEAILAAQDVRGKAVSPFLLDWIQRVTGGASVEVNLDIARGNVDLAAKISRSWSERAGARAPS